MRIARVEIQNWRCFRGEHAIDLGPGAHALVARHEKDAERSNWLGKSSWLWGIRYALTGERPRDCRYEDDWITRGEKDGGVVVVLDDGTRVSRSRARGSSTVLEVEEPDGARSRKDEAQKRIDEILGLGADDARVWFFAQKTMARFVDATPGDRAREVVGWLGLEKLQRAEERARARLNELVEQEHALAAEESADRSTLADVLRRLGFPETTTEDDASREVERRRDGARSVLSSMTTKLDALRRDERAFLAWRANEARRREHDELRREAARAENEARRAGNAAPSDARLDRLRDVARQAEDALRDAERDERGRRTLARGEFDGACPVGGVACPIRDDLNARRRENEEAARAAAERAREAREAADKARRALDAAEALLRAAETARGRADDLRRRLERVTPAGETGEAPADPREERERAEDEQRRAAIALANAEHALSDLARLRGRAEKRQEKLGDLRRRISTAREGVRILGRRGAQRRIAEGALAEIEANANELLARSGIALSVLITWERETRGLASTCDECGAPFGTSTRVRECPRCRAERGPRVDEKLEVELSDRSGAAEDLAGVALSLAASLRIRAERGSSWGVVCLDEPFGALDRAHTRALARGLVSMLRGGWEQALVIAHDDGVMDGMPEKIVVVGGDGGSRIDRA